MKIVRNTKIKITNENTTQIKENPNFYVLSGYLKENDYKTAWGIAWEKASESTKQEFLSLPNFDKNIFFEITGIIL